MKKLFVMLIALIGFGISTYAQTGNYQVVVYVNVSKVYYKNGNTYAFTEEYRQEQQILDVQATSPSDAKQKAETKCTSMCKAEDYFGTETIDGIKYTVKLRKMVTNSSIIRKPE